MKLNEIVELVELSTEQIKTAAEYKKLGINQYSKVYCDECGGCFGPGNADFEHCADHKGLNQQ
jgi:hypothetical protein